MIATLRLLLAAVFLAALALDPTQPTREVTAGYTLLIGYVVTSAVLVRIAWVSWWYDFRLAGWAFAFDIAVFSLSVWFTENPSFNFNSPFTAFFFFLMYAATLRWNWRVTALSAVVTSLAYLAAGIMLYAQGQDIEIDVFLRRLSYMGVIAVALILFGMQSRSGRREPPTEDLVDYGPLEAALRYVARVLPAGTVAIAWEPREEPAMAMVLRDGVLETHRVEALGPGGTPTYRLFDTTRRRCLETKGDESRIAVCDAVASEGLIATARVGEGLSATLRSAQGSRGLLVAGAMDDLAIDDLPRIREIAREAVALIEERALAELERNRAVVQTREALARDLHDSVAQALAGATFGIEALRLTIPETAEEPRRLAAELKATLRTEQAHIRTVIDRLRVAPADTSVVDFAEELADAVEECRVRWGIAIPHSVSGETVIGAPLAYECRQIVREAVSNAVRHGRAKTVEIDGAIENGRLTLAIANDGAPFGTDAAHAQPWTIRERVERLGGRMEVIGGPTPRLNIELPLGRMT